MSLVLCARRVEVHHDRRGFCDSSQLLYGRTAHAPWILLEATSRAWLEQWPGEFLASEIPRLVSVGEVQPAFRSNLRTQVRLPLLVEGEPFFEVDAILAPSLYESLRRKGVLTEVSQRATASAAVFEPLTRGQTAHLGNGDMGLILDVPLELTVVLGAALR